MLHSRDFLPILTFLRLTSVNGMWLADEKGQSSTYRELKAIYYVLHPIVSQLGNKKLKVFTDNDNAARMVLVKCPGFARGGVFAAGIDTHINVINGSNTSYFRDLRGD